MPFSSLPLSSTGLITDTGLTTERLVLRVWTTDEIAAVLNSHRMVSWAEDFPAEGDSVIAGVIAGQSTRPDHGHRLIVERESGLVAGSISLLWPPSEGVVEIGYGVVGSRRGLGYASEATRAMVALALATPLVHTVSAEVELSNPASARVLEKAGMLRCGEDSAVARYATAPRPFL
ncbi:RimJ/RimL family protein N-acetyltransferase [Rhodococcus sp. SMB37]|uniref:GNAT family N-acetyltransferase n=1 Tax=Rhodococcus sp. SMB37 TaxID=2512213 RepID=UPI0006D0DA09|nr:GNAT family N-acetyltransferase [Rhodococcus sp. SMB37]TCN56885.1 RimJ/RimL family protein N-acetyltransferase [Rhodococcus sp. SMB37]